MSHVHGFSCIRTFKFLYFYISCCWYFFDCLPLFLSFSPSYVSCVMASKYKSTPSWNPLRFGASSSSAPSDPIPSHVRFRDEKAKSDFFENFSRRGIHSKRQVILSNFSDTDLPTVINSRGWESLCGIPVTCPSVIIQELYSNMHEFDYSTPFFIPRVQGVCMVVTPDIVSEVLHVPRVALPDYPSCDCLKTVSKDELAFLFCETPSSWGERQNIPCLAFAKGQRFLNMVMTFILHPLSHYNTITKPRARFLLSLTEDLSIDFPSHLILSLIDVYKDTATYDKLIFPSTITRLLRHLSIFYPESPYFTYMCVIDVATVRQSAAQLRPRQPQTQMAAPPASTVPSTSTSFSSTGRVTLEAIMA